MTDSRQIDKIQKGEVDDIVRVDADADSDADADAVINVNDRESIR